MAGKVFLISRGEYSDYYIETVFSNRPAAELYCATHKDCEIEEYELCDTVDTDIETVYRAVSFVYTLNPNARNPISNYHVDYSVIPFNDRLIHVNCKTPARPFGYLEGVISLGESVTEEEKLYKIIYDRVAKWKAENELL